MYLRSVGGLVSDSCLFRDVRGEGVFRCGPGRYAENSVIVLHPRFPLQRFLILIPDNATIGHPPNRPSRNR
jgi:hypothetical protein